MSKTLTRRAHWRPARWTPKMGALPLGLSNVSPAAYGGAVGGLALGLIAGKTVGDALNVSPAAGSAILATISVGVPLLLGPKNISKTLANIFYGAGVGFGSAAILRIVQSFFASPAPAPATAPATAPTSVPATK